MQYITNITVLTKHHEMTHQVVSETGLTPKKVQCDSDTGTTTLYLNILDETAMPDVLHVLTKLKTMNISYSYMWHEKDEVMGGEKHFRYDGANTQHLSWCDNERSTVNIESVRNAILQGDTCVLELLDQVEQEFLPWAWGNIHHS